MSETTYKLCHPCGVALLNADNSGLDEEQIESLEAFEERVGVVAYVESRDNGGVADCDSCEEHVYGEMHIFEQVPRR